MSELCSKPKKPSHVAYLVLVYVQLNNAFQDYKENLLVAAKNIYLNDHLTFLSPCIFISPSIHFLYPLNLSVGLQGGWSLSQRSSAIGRVHPGQVASPSHCHTVTNETNNHTHTLTLTPEDNFRYTD